MNYKIRSFNNLSGYISDSTLTEKEFYNHFQYFLTIQDMNFLQKGSVIQVEDKKNYITYTIQQENENK